MTITITEQIGSQKVSKTSGETLWIANTTAGETSSDVYAQALDDTPSSLLNLYRQNITVNPTKSKTLFFLTVAYSKTRRDAPTPPENYRTSSMSFQYNDEKIFYGINEDGWKGTITTVPDTNNAIRLNKHNKPEGTTVKRAAIVRTEGYVITIMDDAYIKTLHSLAMHVNNATMYGLPAGSVQFVDCNMSSRPDGNFNLSLRFKCQPESKLTVNDLNDGNEMSIKPFWSFWSKTSTTSKTVGTKKVSSLSNLYAKQTQVYPQTDLTQVLPPAAIIVS